MKHRRSANESIAEDEINEEEDQSPPQISSVSEQRHNIENQIVNLVKGSKNPKLKEIMSNSKEAPKIFNTRQLLVNCHDQIFIPKGPKKSPLVKNCKSRKIQRKKTMQVRRNTDFEAHSMSQGGESSYNVILSHSPDLLLNS